MPDHDTIEEVKPEVKPEEKLEGEQIKPEGEGEFVLDYDKPPKQWVPGTTYDPEKSPYDMSDAEYVQWCFDNKMPYWAIKKEILLRHPPKISGVNPNTVEIGADSFTLVVSGENFFAESMIIFAGQDEPTQLNEDGTLSTGVNMGVWHGADVVPVQVRNGGMLSEPVDFTFTAAPEEPETEVNDEHAIDAEGKPVRKSRSKHKK
jgi:hypothetical protein